MFIVNQLKALGNRSDLIFYLISSDLKLRYKNKLLGFLWAILDPFFLMIIYILLVNVIFQRGGPQFAVLLFSALLSWRWFTHAIAMSVKTLTGHGKLIQTVRFPTASLPLTNTSVGLVNYLMGLLVLIPMLFYFKANFTINLLWLPLLIILQFVFTFGVSMIFAVCGLYFRDMQNIIQFAIRLWFYASPALYAVTALPEKYYTIYMALNPFASLFVSYKNILVRGEPPTVFLWVFVAMAISAVLLGFYLFEKKQSTFAKMV